MTNFILWVHLLRQKTKVWPLTLKANVCDKISYTLCSCSVENRIFQQFFFTVRIAFENYLFLLSFFYSVKLIPTIYEMVWTYKTKPDNEVMPWPTWVACITNVSHFLLTFVCSANFFIYYAKHGSLCKSRKAKKRNDLASPTHTQ